MDGWLYRASRLLYVELENAPFIEGKSTLKSSLDTYQRMMQFLEQGAKDEQRDEVLNFLKLKMLQVSDTIYRQRRKQNSSEQYYTTLRIIESQGMPEAFYTRGLESEPQDLSSEERFAYDNRLSTLFEYLWVSERLSQFIAKEGSKIAVNNTTPPSELLKARGCLKLSIHEDWRASHKTFLQKNALLMTIDSLPFLNIYGFLKGSHRKWQTSSLG